jgi:hypothetical protein
MEIPMTFENLKGIKEKKSLSLDTRLEEIIAVGEYLKKKDNPSYRYAYNATSSISVSPEILNQYIGLHIHGGLQRFGMILGKYTGALLHRLAEQSDKPVHIDGQEGKFPFLFYEAQRMPLTVVQNFRGEGICAYVSNATLTLIDVYGHNIGFNAGTLTVSNNTFIRIRGSKWPSFGKQGRTHVIFTGTRWGKDHGPSSGEKYCHNFVRQYPEGTERPYGDEEWKIRKLLQQCETDPINASMKLHEIARSFL